MDVKKKVATGIKISGEDFEYVCAVRKPNADTKIMREFWFKGKVKNMKGGDTNG